MTALEAENKRRMRHYIGAWNGHDPEAIVEFLSPHNEQYSADELRDVAEDWFAAFPDLTHDIEELAAEGDRVLGRAMLRGTHQGTYMGVSPTGTKIEVADHFSTRFEDGLIVEHHATADLYTLFSQLGATVPSERTGAENKALVRRYFEALTDRDRAAFKETLAEEFTYGDIEGPDEMAEMDWKWLEAMDLTWNIEGMYAGDDFVVTRLSATGTHRGKILGLEPTGNSFEISALTL
ncbi:MAG: ester cyclase family protein, partial [Halobacteriales archaeon]|nr:ester cyclase family protein [Halobacteriales archaeon]